MILEFPGPTGYMLTSSGFIYLFKVQFIDSSKVTGNNPEVLNFNRFSLKLKRLICN